MGIKEKFELAEKEIETLVRGKPFANNSGDQSSQKIKQEADQTDEKARKEKLES